MALMGLPKKSVSVRPDGTKNLLGNGICDPSCDLFACDGYDNGKLYIHSSGKGHRQRC